MAPVAPSTSVEHLDVAVVGAGLSGVGAGWYLQEKCPWATFALFEARDAIGGTWDLFRYPGVRSDSDMYTLGYRFRPWDRPEAIADGDSILSYIRDTAAQSGVERRIRFGHRVVAADWSSAEARWHVTAERTDTGEPVRFTCGFLFGCTGYYRYDQGYLPEFDGMDRFEGAVVHPQSWPEDLDVAGKKVVVIGSGATAITLVPALARRAELVTMLQRSPTYVAAVPGQSPVHGIVRRVLPERPAADVTRWLHALLTQGFYRVSRRHPELVKRILFAGLRRELPAGYDIATHFTPRYNPWDQRLCIAPEGDLFEAIRRGRAEVVTDTIERFTPGGIALSSGAEVPADVVVTATGLQLLFFGGAQVSVDGDQVDLPDRMTYKGMMLENVPNFAFSVGYTNASWTLRCDLICDYVCRLLGHMHRQGHRQCTPTNVDHSISPEPLLGLSSGYIQRAAHLFPKQGPRFPWQVRQSYLRDYRDMRLRGVTDDAMVFSSPTPTPTPTPAPAPGPGPADVPADVPAPSLAGAGS